MHVQHTRIVCPVISTWDVSKPSVARASDRDLIKTNVMAIQHGNITAKDTRLFAQVPSNVVTSSFPGLGHSQP